jgi:hypothetical protein
MRQQSVQFHPYIDQRLQKEAGEGQRVSRRVQEILGEHYVRDDIEQGRGNTEDAKEFRDWFRIWQRENELRDARRAERLAKAKARGK